MQRGWLALPLFGAALALGATAQKPSSETAEPVVRRIAFGSCLGQDGVQPIWEHVLAAKPDAFAKLAAQPGFQKLRKHTQVLATWDDHDYGTNDSGADFPAKEMSRQTFLDFWGVAKDSPRRGRDGVYDSVVLGPPGKRVQIILLDTRFNRTPLAFKENAQDLIEGGRYQPNSDPTATILGAAQWAWLEQLSDGEGDASIVSELEDRQNVGVRQRRDGLSLALEARVARAVDLAHPARRSIEEMNSAPIRAGADQAFDRFLRHCARYWAIAPRHYPRGVFKFRGIEEAQVARARVTTQAGA